MPNRLFQNMLQQISGDIGRVVGVVDESGRAIACNNEEKLDVFIEDKVVSGLGLNPNFTVSGGYTYKAIEAYSKSGYYVFCEGVDDTARGYCALVSAYFANMKQYYDDKYDKNSFIKNIVLDNILSGDIMYRARELHLPLDVRRTVFLVRFNDVVDTSITDILLNMFPDKNKDFIINIDDHEIALVKELKKNSSGDELEKTAQTMVDMLNSEGMIKANVGVSNPCDSIQDLARAYRESRIAIDVGKVFGSEKNVVTYNNLGIGRLIYQLPTTLCELFLQEVFQKETIDVLDDETIFTIQKFFENNLNVSETSRKLFVHRNTLVYRLDKIKKLTGLDLREFDDAIIFKVAMMVNKYLLSQKGM